MNSYINIYTYLYIRSICVSSKILPFANLQCFTPKSRSDHRYLVQTSYSLHIRQSVFLIRNKSIPKLHSFQSASITIRSTICVYEWRFEIAAHLVNYILATTAAVDQRMSNALHSYYTLFPKSLMLLLDR